MNQLNLEFDAAHSAMHGKKANALPHCEEPHIRFEAVGTAALSDTELLTLILGTGTKACSARDLAAQLMAHAGSLAELAGWHVTDFQRIKGIGRMKGRQLSSIIEMARRIVRTPQPSFPILDSAKAISAFMQPIVLGLDVEKFWVLCLNRKCRLKKMVEISSGSATSTLAPPRDIFRAAVREGAIAVAVVHNHPSGDPYPSSADCNVTRQLRDAGHHLDIPLEDHVIVGRPEVDPQHLGYFSFRESGRI